MKKLQLLIIGSVAMAALNAMAGGFCFTNVLFHPAAKAHYQWIKPPLCGIDVTNANPTHLDPACCFNPTGSHCDDKTALHLLVVLIEPYSNTNTTPKLLGVMTWVNAGSGKTNATPLFMPLGTPGAEFELQADVEACPVSLLHWKVCATAWRAKENQSDGTQE